MLMQESSSSSPCFSSPHSSSLECEIAEAAGCCWRGLWEFSLCYLDISFFFFFSTLAALRRKSGVEDLCRTAESHTRKHLRRKPLRVSKDNFERSLDDSWVRKTIFFL